jgi:hypothetical protein
MRLDERGVYIVETPQLGDLTVVHDRKRNMQVMRVQGVVVLPVGAEIELTNPNANATVTGVRLLASGGNVPAHVCLDVEVPDEYWTENTDRGTNQSSA